MLPMSEFVALAQECAPSVAPQTLLAVASVESGFSPHAIGVVGGRLSRQPKGLPEAISTALTLRAQGVRFSAGLMQIYVGNWSAHQLDHESVFDPCANLRAAAAILGSCYARASSARRTEQGALRDALSCYYSNNFVTGYSHGYVQKVVAAAFQVSRPDVSDSSPAHEGASRPTRASQP